MNKNIKERNINQYRKIVKMKCSMMKEIKDRYFISQFKLKSNKKFFNKNKFNLNKTNKMNKHLSLSNKKY